MQVIALRRSRAESDTVATKGRAISADIMLAWRVLGVGLFMIEWYLVYSRSRQEDLAQPLLRDARCSDR
jgi:hypothetical protein